MTAAEQAVLPEPADAGTDKTLEGVVQVLLLSHTASSVRLCLIIGFTMSMEEQDGCGPEACAYQSLVMLSRRNALDL